MYNEWTPETFTQRRQVLVEWILDRWGTEETDDSLTESELEEEAHEDEVSAEAAE